MEAIVLAGGFGTRLKSVVKDLPKPMAPINGVPFLCYIIEYLKKNGIRRIILSVGYKWNAIKAFFGDNWKGIELVYCVEDRPLGTGGAIKKSVQYVNNKDVYVINGDTYFDIPLGLLKKEFKAGCKLIFSLKRMKDFDRYGCVDIDVDGFVKGISEKKYIVNGFINGGIYLMDKNIFDDYSLEERFSFEQFVKKNYDSFNARAIIFDNYFIDIGIPEDYIKAQFELK